MDFPLPIRAVTTVDYFTPLHVDTNIEYTLDMEKFPELSDPSHYWQPALVIGSHSSPFWDPSMTSSDMTSSHDLAFSENHQEILDLIDVYALEDLQEDDLDFGLVDLAPLSPHSVLDTTGVYLDSSFTTDLQLSVNNIQSTADDSGFVSETDEDCDDQSIVEETVLSSRETTSCRLRQTIRRCKRKRCESAISVQTDVPTRVCKRGKLEISDESHMTVGPTQKNCLLNTVHLYSDQTSPDIDSRDS